jgi:hypothetical protein
VAVIVEDSLYYFFFTSVTGKSAYVCYRCGRSKVCIFVYICIFKIVDGARIILNVVGIG